MTGEIGPYYTTTIEPLILLKGFISPDCINKAHYPGDSDLVNESYGYYQIKNKMYFFIDGGSVWNELEGYDNDHAWEVKGPGYPSPFSKAKIILYLFYTKKLLPIQIILFSNFPFEWITFGPYL